MSHKEEKWVRSYLLGELPQERAQQLEERLLRDDDFAEHLQLVEDELVEDFARGTLGARERQRFETYFLSTPRRRRKLLMVRALRKYSAGAGGEAGAATAPERVPRLKYWLHAALTPRWAAAAAALILLAAGLGVWRAFFHLSDVEKGLVALNEAYRVRRPLEARVTGLGYAPYAATRGGGDEAGADRLARDRSAAILQNAAAEDPSADALHALGRVYLMRKDFDQAVLRFEQALKSAPDDARLHSDLGAALFEKGKLERLSDQTGAGETTLARSLAELDRALQLDGALLDARFNRALVYQELNLAPQALGDWEKYVSQDPGSPWGEEARRKIEEIRARRDKVSRREGDLFRDFLDAQRAGDPEQTWRLFSKSHLRTGNAITNRLVDDYLASREGGRDADAAGLSGALAQLGRLSHERAADPFTEDVARVYASASPARLKTLAQARGLLKSAYELNNQSRNDQAIALFSRAKSLFEQAGDHPEALLADFWAGHCYSQQADARRSISVFGGVAAGCEARGYKWLRALTMNGLANLRARSTMYSQAVADGWAAYRLASEIGDENGMLRGLSTLASLYRSLGNYRQSLHLSRQGFTLAAEISADASQVIGLYATSAWSLNALGHYAAALEYERHALSLGEAMNNNPLVLSRYRVQMGLIQGRLRNYEEAIRNIRLGIEIGQGLGAEKLGGEMTAYARLYLGRTYRESGSFADALAVLDEVVGFCRENDQLWLLHEAAKERLLTHIAQGEVGAAREELGRVLDAYEGEREKILEARNRSSFFDKEQDIYDVAIDFAHTHLSDAAQSFAYSESSRARSLFDAAAAEWRMHEEAGLPDLRFQGSLRPMPLEEIRRRLPAGSQLLQYAALKDRLVIWYVSGGRFESRTVNVGAEELAAKVERMLALVSAPAGDDGQLLGAASELHDLLIAPVAPLLDGGKQLCVIPDKSLHLLPFGALFSAPSRRYLVEDFALSYAPSANLFVLDTEAARARQDARGERLLAVGNPRFDRGAFPLLEDLPSAAREAEEISALYDARSLLTGREATKASVQAEMRRADVLHLATHFVPDSSSPMLSKLLLASAPGRPGQARTADGVLEAHELYRLKPARPRLVVLSACMTGAEGFSRSEGAVGLTRPFKAAGAPLVVASLWPVDSEATADLMIGFHRLRRQAGLPTAEALRAAAVQMLNHPNPSYRRPYYWASFALAGGYSNY